MAKRLNEHVTSGWVNAANRMAPRKAKRKIVAYVESYDDVSFWRNLFNEFETEQCTFQVMLPSSSSLAKGKKTALMNVLGDSGLGENMIACVDSDYDYLLQGVTRLSRRILNSPYIFHTYAYAIENYQCYAESLHEVCVQATLNDRALMDFPLFLQRYSQVIHPLFLWSVAFYRKRDLITYPLLKFCSDIRILYFDLHTPYNCLDSLKKHVNRQVAYFSKHFPDMASSMGNLRNELETLGVTPDNTYLFIQGHHLMDNVVMKLLVPVCTLLRRERETEIKRLAEHDEQRRNELTCYQNSQCPVELMLRKNTCYRDLSLYKRLRQDISRFLKLK